MRQCWYRAGHRRQAPYEASPILQPFHEKYLLVARVVMARLCIVSPEEEYPGKGLGEGSDACQSSATCLAKVSQIFSIFCVQDCYKEMLTRSVLPCSAAASHSEVEEGWRAW